MKNLNYTKRKQKEPSDLIIKKQLEEQKLLKRKEDQAKEEKIKD